MAELSRDEIVEVLGRLSDVIIAEIIATGITKPRVAVAQDTEFRNLHAFGPEEMDGRFRTKTA